MFPVRHGIGYAVAPPLRSPRCQILDVTHHTTGAATGSGCGFLCYQKEYEP